METSPVGLLDSRASKSLGTMAHRSSQETLDVQVPIMHALPQDAMDRFGFDRLGDPRRGDSDRCQQCHGRIYFDHAGPNAWHSQRHCFRNAFANGDQPTEVV